MKSAYKKLFSLLLAIILIAAVPFAMAEEADKPEKLTVLLWGGVDSQVQYDAAITKYWTPLYPDIPVETILVPVADITSKLMTMIATNTAPDVLWVQDQCFHLYMNEGLLANLSVLLEDEEYDYMDFVAAQRETYSVDGVPYSIPFSSPPEVLFYNKTLVEAAGLETPNELYAKGEWTSEKMYEYALALNDRENGVYGVNYTRAAQWNDWNCILYPVIRAFGGEFWSTDGKEVLLDSEEAIKGMQMLGDLIFVHGAHPMPGDTADFFAGNCALYPSFLGDMRKCADVGFEWDIAPMPTAPDGSYAAYLGTASIGVYEKGEHKDYAIELLKVLTGKGFIGELQNTYIPPRVSCLGSESFVTGDNGAIPRPPYESYKAAVLDQADVIRTPDMHPNIQQINEVILTNMEAFFMQALTAEECIQNMAAEMEAFMVE